MNDQASVRYLVDNVDDAAEFYVKQLASRWCSTQRPIS